MTQITATIGSLVVLASLSLGGCERSNQSVCTTPMALEDAMAALSRPQEKLPTEVAAAVDESIRHEGFVSACVHRWAYRLAGSRDGAGVVADAVVAGCEVPVRNWASVRARAFEYAEPVAYEHSVREMRRLALFHVVQARAGNCAVPK